MQLPIREDKYRIKASVLNRRDVKILECLKSDIWSVKNGKKNESRDLGESLECHISANNL